MKRGLVLGSIFVLLVVYFIGSAGAISSNTSDSYQPRESIIASVNGNILNALSTDNVKFYRNGHIETPLVFDFKKLGDSYYLWAIAPEILGNYTIRVSNINTVVSGMNQVVTYEKNFSVAGNLTDYYINPGFVILSGDFDVVVWLNEDLNKDILVSFPEEVNYTLKPGSNKIHFYASDFADLGITDITIGKYSLIVYAANINGLNITSTKRHLEFIPDAIDRTINSSDTQSFRIILKNNGRENITGININFNDSIMSISDERESGFFSSNIPGKEISLNTGESYPFNLTLNEFPSEKIDEMIYAVFENSSVGMRFELFPINESALEQNLSENGSTQTCTALQGSKCGSSESCGGNSVTAADGECCIGQCTSGGGGGAWIAYLIFAFLGISGLYVWYKYKKTGNINPFKKKVEEAEKKMNSQMQVPAEGTRFKK